MSHVEKKLMKAKYKIRAVNGGVYAIRSKKTGKMLIQSTQDLAGARNRFTFAQKTGGGLPLKVQKAWQQEGPEQFEFVVLEELEKAETQTEGEFAEDMQTLKEMWLEKINPEELY